MHVQSTSRKLLGYIVSHRGIEVDLNKVKDISEMPTPRTKKEVRGFIGRLQYISRFIAKLTIICEPIFKLLRKDQLVGGMINVSRLLKPSRVT